MERYESNLAHLQGALLVLNLELHRQVLRWRAMHHDEASPDELAGVYMSDREVDALLDGLYAANAPAQTEGFDQSPLATLTRLLEEARTSHQQREAAALAAGVPLRLPLLAEQWGLNDFERRVVLLTLSIELDRHYERLFGYLNDELSRRLPTVDLALQLFCADLPERVACRLAFAPDAPLRALRVLHLTDDIGGFLGCGLRLDARVTNDLLGFDQPDALLYGVLTPPDAFLSSALQETLPVEVESLYWYLREQPQPIPAIALTGSDDRQQIAASAYLAAACGLNLLVLDAAPNTVEEMLPRALRETYRQGAALAVQNAQVLLTKPAVLRRLLDADRPRFLLSSEPLAVEAVHVHLPALDKNARERVWSALLDGYRDTIDISELADRFRLTGGQIAAAVTQAKAQSAALGDPINRTTLFASCRAQSSTALSGLAQPIHSIHTWDDLILPPEVKMQLRTLEHWVRYRHTVYHEWGFAERIMLGQGLSVLFSGPSGTGKTMAAGILARNLELDLYRIDLSAVVSKYIGETEKNLSTIFEAAQSANAILFFDEADALFGKRSEVKDAHDRYANIEVSYLLQRMEAYDGVAILATNFRQNLDQAFTRRLHRVIEFPLPNAVDRERIWRGLLPDHARPDAKTAPLDRSVDLPYLARQFALTGGNIKNCALDAAFAAAAEGKAVEMRHLIQAVARELEKTNQSIVRANFGEYYDLIRES